jgi:hypothetical protein
MPNVDDCFGHRTLTTRDTNIVMSRDLVHRQIRKIRYALRHVGVALRGNQLTFAGNRDRKQE